MHHKFAELQWSALLLCRLTELFGMSQVDNQGHYALWPYKKWFLNSAFPRKESSNKLLGPAGNSSYDETPTISKVKKIFVTIIRSYDKVPGYYTSMDMGYRTTPRVQSTSFNVLERTARVSIHLTSVKIRCIFSGLLKEGRTTGRTGGTGIKEHVTYCLLSNS